MKLIIDKDLKIENPTQSVISYCEDKLTLTNPDYIIANKLGRWVGSMEKSIKLYSRNGDTLILPFGCLDDIWKISKGAMFENKIHNHIGSSLQGSIKLYDYQERAVETLINGKNGILEAGCGSGKTMCGLEIAKRLQVKTLWLTHTKKLLEQSKARAEMYYHGDFGTITEGSINVGKDITFATVQTMSKIDISKYENAFDCVIVDECHHCIGTPTKVMQFYKIITNINARYKYGLSATLNRSDGLISCVYSIIGKKLHTITTKEVGDKIIKAEHTPIMINIDFGYDYTNEDGTLNYNMLINVLSENQERNNIILEQIRKHSDKKQIVLCHRVKQVELFYNVLSSEGYKVSKLIGKIKDKNRSYNENIIVATYSLAKEGLDIPTLEIVHLVTPSKDKTLVKQSVGRVERNVEGKGTPHAIDYVDTQIPYCLMCYKKRSIMLKKDGYKFVRKN